MAKYYTKISSIDTVNGINASEGYGLACSQDLDRQDIDCRKVTATGEVKCTSTTAPFYPPVVTTGQRTGMSGLTAGAMVYDSDIGSLYFYNGSTWKRVEVVA